MNVTKHQPQNSKIGIMMKKTKTILCLGIALCMFGCSDDDDDTTTSTVPFTLNASLSSRSTDAADAGLLQGNWTEGSQLAVMKTGASGVKKGIFTYSPVSSVTSTTFTGSISTSVKNENEIAVFYPASAITANSSDTLTQKLSLKGQDGTLAGIANYDYSWAKCKAAMDKQSGAADCEMTNLMSIGKFQFTTDGATPLNGISTITVSGVTGNLYSRATVKLKDGAFSSTTAGSFTIENQEGLSGTVYISFFPSETQLHFTLVTIYGEIYETSTAESIKLEKGKVFTSAPLTCTLLAPAKVGDYYYSDGTYSTQRDENKTCIGIVYTLTDRYGNMSTSLLSSPHGRIVALGDNKSGIKWMSKSEDVSGLENYANVNGTQTIGSLPYYKGNADSFYSDKDEERIKNAIINVGTGTITSWVSAGALSDFNGEANTSYTNSSTSNYPAGSYCYEYSTAGKGAGEWYLPAAGELALLWELQQSGIICNAKQDCFYDFVERSYWSSSESSETTAWYVNFLSGTIVANSKGSTYSTRPVAKF